MPNTSSAKKELTKNARKQEINSRVKVRMKKFVKELKELTGKLEKSEEIAQDEMKDLEKMLSAAYKAIDKAAKKGIIKKNNAARKKSGLAKQINRLQEKDNKK